MADRDIEKLISMLESEKFNIVLGLDKGGFQNLVLDNWTTIRTALVNEAGRQRHLCVAPAVKPT